jgi:hypothetical protein
LDMDENSWCCVTMRMSSLSEDDSERLLEADILRADMGGTSEWRKSGQRRRG